MKKLFTWYKKYSVNNEELDNHHKALFDIFNRLYANCLAGSSSNSLEPLIAELVAYADYHFAAEEKYMTAVGYKDSDRHIAEHKLFAERILQFHGDKNAYHCENAKELIVFLGNWLLNHVMVEDKRISL